MRSALVLSLTVAQTPTLCPEGYASNQGIGPNEGGLTRTPFPNGDVYSGCKVENGAIINEDGSKCCSCPRGMFQSQQGQTSCTMCEAGLYSESRAATDESTCAPCPAGQSTSTWDDGVCNDGSCFFGQPLDYNLYQCCDKCSMCPKGMYQGASGQTSCDGCKAGMHSYEMGLISSDGCSTFSALREAALGFVAVLCCIAISLFLLFVPAKLLV